MNKKQKLALTCGIIVLSLVLLFPPLDENKLTEKDVGFIFTDYSDVDYIQLNFHNLVVAVVTAAFIYGLRNKKDSEEAKEDDQGQQ